MKHDRYFQDFLEDHVNLNKSRIDTLKARKKAITDFLKGKYDRYTGYSNQGSYAHKTIIKPVDDNDEFDVDILAFVKDSSFDPDSSQTDYTDYVEEIYQIFREDGNYKDKVKKNTRCVTIQYKGDFHLDIVPCVKHSDTHYICNSRDRKYEETDGDGYKEWLIDKNKTVGNNNFREVTKLSKYLRDYKNTFSAKSILLTTMLGNQVSELEDYADLPTSLKALCNRLNNFLQENWSMPIISNPVLPKENFNRHWTQEKYENFREKFNSYNDKINDSYEEEDHNKSVKKWRKIFGDDFGELKDDDSENSCGTKAAPAAAIPAKKPWADSSSPRNIGVPIPQYSDSELEKLRKCFSVKYDRTKNRITMEMKIDPCHFVEDKAYLSGWRIESCDKYQEKVVEGKYFIRIDLNNGKVFELSEKIQKTAKELNKSNTDLHLSSDGSCCLEIDIKGEINTRIEKKPLSEFVWHDVYPYFVWQAYYAKYKEIPPVGELSHGWRGIEEAENDYRQGMKHPHKQGSHRNKPCPCGSGEKYKKCCLKEDQQKSIDLVKFNRLYSKKV